jgi:hypothetical protein
MTHSMSIFCVIRSATALSVTAAVNIRPDTRTTKPYVQAPTTASASFFDCASNSAILAFA